MLKRLAKSNKWPALLSFLALGTGIGLVAGNTAPATFWTNIGFVIVGTALAVGVAFGVARRILVQRQASQGQEPKRKLLRAIGLCCVEAISKGFRQNGLPQFTHGGRDLTSAWHYGIETGTISPVGLTEAVYRQYDEAVYHDEGRQAERLLRRRTVLTDDWLDLHIALALATKALGMAYAGSDLFDSQQLPTRSLELAAATLKDGRDSGKLDDFQGALLILYLLESAEACGKLLWELRQFVQRSEPLQDYHAKGHGQRVGRKR